MTHIDKMSISNKVIVRGMSNCQLNVKNVLTTPIEPAFTLKSIIAFGSQLFRFIIIYHKVGELFNPNNLPQKSSPT